MIIVSVLRRPNNGNNEYLFPINRRTCRFVSSSWDEIRYVPEASNRQRNLRLLVKRRCAIYRRLRQIRNKRWSGLYQQRFSRSNVNRTRGRQITQDRGSCFKVFLMATRCHVRQSNSICPCNVFQRVDICRFIVAFSSQRSFPLEGRIPSFEEGGLVPIVTCACCVRYLRKLVRLFPISIIPRRRGWK